MNINELSNLNSLSERLDYAFKKTREKIDPENKLKAKEAYIELGLSQSAFSAYRKDTSPNARVLAKLSEPCGFSINWLVTGEGPVFTRGCDGYVERIKHITAHADTIDISTDLLKGIPITDGLRYDIVIDDKMTTVAGEGNIIVIDTLLRIGGGIFCIEFDNQRIIRRLQTKSAATVLLISDHGNQEVPINDVVVLGRVIWRAGKP